MSLNGGLEVRIHLGCGSPQASLNPQAFHSSPSLLAMIQYHALPNCSASLVSAFYNNSCADQKRYMDSIGLSAVGSSAVSTSLVFDPQH